MSAKDFKTSSNKLSRESSRKNLRLGIIGCGAITESQHLPAALSSSAIELTFLCDTNQSRLRYLQKQFGLRLHLFTDYREIFDRVDSVILALPNSLHAPVGIDLLSHGIHVLCEKPLALNQSECDQLSRAARETHSVLAVSLVSRFFPSTRLTKQLIDSGFLGTLRSFDYEYGTAGGWATVSGYNLSRSLSGGGVLVVSGSHFIDRMQYLFGDVDVISYSDDAHGGVEANCVAWFSVHISGEALKGSVTLSKTHNLSNRLRIVGDNGILEVGEGQKHSVTFFPSGNKLRHEVTYSEFNHSDKEQNYFKVQLHDFVHAIQTKTPPMVTAEEGSKSVAIMERCYEIATPLEESWSEATLELLRAAGPQH